MEQSANQELADMDTPDRSEMNKRRRPTVAAFARKTTVIAAFTVLIGILFLSIPLGSRVLFDTLQIYPPLAASALTAEPGETTAIVVLSAGRRQLAPEFGEEFNEQALDGLSLERLRYGAFLSRKTGLPILVSGGIPLPGKPTLADLMATTLQIDYAISAKWIENRSNNTAENAIFSVETLKRAGVNHVILVTHAWHMKRAVASFVANGMSVTAAPTAFYRPGRDETLDTLIPAAATLQMSTLAMHEIIGQLWYSIRYGY